jgi:hypothetical protein
MNTIDHIPVVQLIRYNVDIFPQLAFARAIAVDCPGNELMK